MTVTIALQVREVCDTRLGQMMLFFEMLHAFFLEYLNGRIWRTQNGRKYRHSFYPSLWRHYFRTDLAGWMVGILQVFCAHWTQFRSWTETSESQVLTSDKTSSCIALEGLREKWNKHTPSYSSTTSKAKLFFHKAGEPLSYQQLRRKKTECDYWK